VLLDQPEYEVYPVQLEPVEDVGALERAVGLVSMEELEQLVFVDALEPQVYIQLSLPLSLSLSACLSDFLSISLALFYSMNH